MLLALRLAKAGWWDGDPERVLQAPVDLVVAAIQYEAFTTDYQDAYLDLNKETP